LGHGDANLDTSSRFRYTNCNIYFMKNPFKRRGFIPN
jgi:hypothetical protein